VQRPLDHPGIDAVPVVLDPDHPLWSGLGTEDAYETSQRVRCFPGGVLILDPADRPEEMTDLLGHAGTLTTGQSLDLRGVDQSRVVMDGEPKHAEAAREMDPKDTRGGPQRTRQEDHTTIVTIVDLRQ
jgi:hypothetical protein